MKKILVCAIMATVMLSSVFMSACGFGTPLSAPVNLKVTGTLLTWDPVENAKGYKVKVGETESDCIENKFELAQLSLADGEYKIMVKAKGKGGYADSDYSMAIDYKTVNNPENVDATLAQSAVRYDAVAAPLTNNIPPLIASSTDNAKNYYLFDGGYIRNVPITSGTIVNYNGQTAMTVRFEQSTVTETRVEESISKTVTESFSQTGMHEIGVQVTGGTGENGPFNIQVQTGYTRTWGETSERENSLTNTYTTAYMTAQTLTEAIEFTIGANGEKAGDYRLSMMTVCDVYFILTTSRDNSSLLECEVVVCARTDIRFVLEYDVENGNFSKTSESPKIDLSTEFYRNLEVPVYKPGDNVKPIDARIVTASFTAKVYCENSDMGTATFNVRGVKVKYNEKDYVFGTAFYSGNLGSFRYNDVDTISLRNTSKGVLFGGTLHWQGEVNNNNESGTACWDKSRSNSNTAMYSVLSLTDDFPASTNQKISITDICVQLNDSSTEPFTTPEVVTTSMSANIYTERSDRGRVQFEVIGVKVQYQGKNYVYGNAFYKGTPGSSRFNDVDEFNLKNANREILLGGTLHWQQNVTEMIETGIGGWHPVGNKYEARYIVQDSTRDFAGDKETRITITGFCVEYNGDFDKGAPEMVAKNFSASLHTEGTYSGTFNFTALGLKVVYNESNYLFGSAYSSANPGRERFNDVDTIYLKNLDRKVLFGGTLHWMQDYDNDNESDVAGFDASSGYDRLEVRYMVNNPTRDFAANKETRIGITGICVAY